MKIPIVLNHDISFENIIGYFEDGIVTLNESIYLFKEQINKIFGDIGYIILESEKSDQGAEFEKIKKIKILEWSFTSK